MKNGKESAFGFAATLDHPFGQPEVIVEHGLTKREYFAALAMQGFCMWEAFTSEKAVAEASVRQADALLEELNKTK